MQFAVVAFGISLAVCIYNMKRYQKILDLRPTQFAVGMLEVDEKIKMVSALSKKERTAFIEDTKIPVVRSPQGRLYVVDKHHFLCVCYHLGVTEVKVDIVKDFFEKKISFVQFWKWMSKTRNSYPYCQFGEGPRQEFYLPKDVRGLADDPYRSIAWFVRKAGAYENSDRNFAEFAWANFFRSKNLLQSDDPKAFEKALLKATKLAQTPEAKKLPGYDALKPKEQSVVSKKIVKQVKLLKNSNKKVQKVLAEKVF